MSSRGTTPKIGRKLQVFVGLLLIVGCSSKFLKYDKAPDLKKNEEFSEKVKIEEPTAPPDAGDLAAVVSGDVTRATTTSGDATTAKPLAKNKKSVTTTKKSKTEKKTKTEASASSSTVHEPSIEDQDGWVGRRPVNDPFRVGEKVVHKVYYEAAIFGFTAGYLTMKTNPFATVNDRKAYSFDIGIVSSSFFSSYYSVDDKVRTYMDYDNMVPTTFTMHVKESKQLREAQMFFDFTKNSATYWEKKYTEKDGTEEKKQQWEILPFSQNVFSAAYYMRTFEWKDGKEYSFRVADDNENLTFKGRVVKRETLKTDAGVFKAIKIKPEFAVKGVFKPVGDIFIWLSDDDRKYILRIESKIKIGSLISEISELTPGQ